MKKRTRYVRIVGLGSAFTMDLVHPCQGEVISYLPVSGVSVECEVMELSLIYDLQNKYNFHSLTGQRAHHKLWKFGQYFPLLPTHNGIDNCPSIGAKKIVNFSRSYATKKL